MFDINKIKTYYDKNGWIKYHVKYYNCECIKCGEHKIISEYNFKKAVCRKCKNMLKNTYEQSIKEEKNINKDKLKLKNNRPDLSDIILDWNIFKEESIGSNLKVNAKCNCCGNPREIQIRHLVNYGVSCEKCSRSTSYPENFMYCLLESLNIKFETQKVFEWNPRKRYDFYIPSLNCIIETHGLQHYANNSYFKMSLKSQKIRDKEKKKLALFNNIQEYIELDCRTSTMEYLIKSIKGSGLKKFLDLTKVNYTDCNIYAMKNFNNVKEIVDEFNLFYIENKDNITAQKIIDKNKELAIKYRTTTSTIRNYLKNNESYYDGNFVRRNFIRINSKMCVSDIDRIAFNSLSSCSKKYNISYPSVRYYCDNKNKKKQNIRGLRYYNPDTDKDLPIYVDTKDKV